MLELKDINYTVTEESGEQKTIIDGLNLEIEDGRFVVITGPNGGEIGRASCRERV